MFRMPWLAEYARLLIQALHWINDNLYNMIETMQSACPDESVTWLAQVICNSAIEGVYA